MSFTLGSSIILIAPHAPVPAKCITDGNQACQWVRNLFNSTSCGLTVSYNVAIVPLLLPRYIMSSLFMYQPFKAVYLGAALAGLLLLLPLWTLLATVPAFRPRRSWTIIRTVTVWGFRYLLPVLFRTRAFATTMVDPMVLAKNPKHGLVWVNPDPELVVGEIKTYAERQGVEPVKLAGYWYGQRDLEGAVGTPANPGERVIYELHGEY